MGESVLITGAHGFLGRHMARLFGKKGYYVIGMGHGEWSADEREEWNISEWHECDIGIGSLTAYAGRPNIIIHCAGSGSVGFSLSNPVEDFNRTVNTTLAVLEYIRLYNKDTKLIYPSSAAVYGAKGVGPISEDDFLNPVSPYGYHKKIAEELCGSYSKNFNLTISIIRFFSLYGNGLRKQLLWDACNKFSKGDKKVIFSGSGEETRDWIHIQDAALLIYRVFSSSLGINIFNGGSGERVTVREILELVGREFSENRIISFNGLAKEGDPKHYQADTKRSRALGWEPEVDWQSGVKDYVRWFKETEGLI